MASLQGSNKLFSLSPASLFKVSQLCCILFISASSVFHLHLLWLPFFSLALRHPLLGCVSDIAHCGVHNQSFPKHLVRACFIGIPYSIVGLQTWTWRPCWKRRKSRWRNFYKRVCSVFQAFVLLVNAVREITS